MAKVKKHLGFTPLRKMFSNYLFGLTDNRNQNKCKYYLHDVIMSAFACMYFQEPSLLSYQQKMQEEHDSNNIKTIFGVKELPSDTQMRRIIDQFNPANFNYVFKECLTRLQRGKHLELYQLFPHQYLCALDGTQFFSSTDIHCKHCLTTKKSQTITYSHKVMQAAIMHPDKRQVLPMMAEEIRNEDGVDKQDCEVKATKRLISVMRKEHPQLKFILTGDSIFSNMPMIEIVNKNRMSYIFTAKPSNHPYLMEWLTGEILEQDSYIDQKGRIHKYKWCNKVPLNGQKHAPLVNYFHYSITTPQKDGTLKQTYQCSWVTNVIINIHNIRTLVKGGRCRWKIENECFNTLKNQGYHIKHNYGHGKENLCFNFYLLTLLAFYFHQILELTDRTFSAARKIAGSLTRLWEALRQAIDWILFQSWEILIDSFVHREKYKLTALSKPP